jgi:hypothetical protein
MQHVYKSAVNKERKESDAGKGIAQTAIGKA